MEMRFHTCQTSAKFYKIKWDCLWELDSIVGNKPFFYFFVFDQVLKPDNEKESKKSRGESNLLHHMPFSCTLIINHDFLHIQATKIREIK